MNDSSLKEKASRRLGFGAVLAAPFFLFNPDYAVVDILPDFIGYILLCFGLMRLRDISAHFDAAYTGFYRLVWLSAAKFASVFLLFGFINEQERPTLMLLLMFCFAVGDFIIGIPAWSELFEGLVQCCQTVGGSAALAGERKRRGSITDRIRRATVAAIIIRDTLDILPEFSVLSSQKYDDSAFDWYLFTDFFRICAISVSLVLGIIWLVRAVKYFAAINKDSELFSAAGAKYTEEILSKPGILIRRRIKAALAAFTFSAFICADFYIDSVNILPDTLCAVSFIVTFLLMRRFSRRWKAGLCLASAFGALSAAEWVLSYLFHQQWTDIIVQKSPEAWTDFMTFYPFKIAYEITFMLTLGAALLCIADIIRDHCGYIPENLDPEYRKNKLADIRRELYKRATVCAAFGLVTGMCGLLYDWIITYSSIYISNIWWLIVLVLSLGTGICAAVLSQAVRDEADSRYMFD